MYLLLIYSLNFNMVCVCVHVHVHTHGIHVVRGQHKSCFFFSSTVGSGDGSQALLASAFHPLSI